MRKDRQRRYNSDWLAVASDIRLRRAKNKCEKCGREHGRLISRQYKQEWRYASDAEMQRFALLRKEKQMTYWQVLKSLHLKQVALTVAHLDRNERNDAPENLLCLCQWCHLQYDRADNAARRYFGYCQNQLPISYTE